MNICYTLFFVIILSAFRQLVSPRFSGTYRSVKIFFRKDFPKKILKIFFTNKINPPLNNKICHDITIITIEYFIFLFCIIFPFQNLTSPWVIFCIRACLQQEI